MNNPLDWAEEKANQFYDWQSGVVSDAWDTASGKDANKATADAIGAAAAKDQAYNFPDVFGPLGSQTNEVDPVTGKVTVRSSLSEPQQGLVNGLYGDAGDSRQRIEDALYARSTSRLDPQWSDRADQSRTQLYGQGLQEGDAAFDRAKRNEDFARNDAYAGARNTAITAGGQEQSRIIDAIMKASNPGLDKYWGQPNATNAAIAQGNVNAQTPSVLDAILGIAGAVG